MIDFFENLINNLNIFDLFFLIIIVYFVIQCFLKGFSMSLISFMKWVVSTIVTIILVPKFQPVVSEYIQSKFINNIGLGVVIFIFTLFITILVGKSMSKAVTWTGVGSIDKGFGFLFGFLKGYIVAVCLFTILNWFYPYQNWGISAEKAISFNLIYKGSEILIEEFIGGREIQVAIMGKRKLGAIELKPKRKFYDYKAKYEKKAGTNHIIPVELPKSKMNNILNIAMRAHNLIGCRGITRSDFKYYSGKFYLLEINTQPGMTKLSLVPEIANYNNITFAKLLDWMLNDSSINR